MSVTLRNRLELQKYCCEFRPRVQPLARRRKRSSLPISAAYVGQGIQEEEIHPAYKKYRNIYETTDAELRQIERDEAHNVELPPPTVLSVLQYVLGCFKFYLMPRPLRYLWYHIWTRLRAVYYPYHKRLVLKGSQLDYYLLQKARQQPEIRRSIALKRFHWRMNLWENVIYRGVLIKDVILHSITKKT